MCINQLKALLTEKSCRSNIISLPTRRPITYNNTIIYCSIICVTAIINTIIKCHWLHTGIFNFFSNSIQILNIFFIFISAIGLQIRKVWSTINIITVLICSHIKQCTAFRSKVSNIFLQ